MHIHRNVMAEFVKVLGIGGESADHQDIVAECIRL